jgi:hypothetical protein
MWRATILIACLSVTGCDDAPKKPATSRVKDAAETERLKRGLFVSIGPWSDMESSDAGVSSGPLFQLQITQTMLADAECPILVTLTAQHMRRLLQAN